MNKNIIVSSILVVFIVIVLSILVSQSHQNLQPTTSQGSESIAPRTPSSTATSTAYQIYAFTAAEVASHNSSTNCWSIINDGVYNLTSWIGQHPGGQQAILALCGRDGSADFNDTHGGQQRPASELTSFKIGILK